MNTFDKNKKDIIKKVCPNSFPLITQGNSYQFLPAAFSHFQPALHFGPPRLLISSDTLAEALLETPLMATGNSSLSFIRLIGLSCRRSLSCVLARRNLEMPDSADGSAIGNSPIFHAICYIAIPGSFWRYEGGDILAPSPKPLQG